MYTSIPNDEQIKMTVEALKANGIDAVVVNTGEEAKELVLNTIPEGAQVMTMTSVTLEKTGIVDAISQMGKHKPARNVLHSQEASEMEKKQAGHLSDWVVGSVHAVTESGQVVIASNTGSQLPSYAYSSDHVLWIIGAQKLVKDLDAAMKRLNEHTIPLESVRARKAYGLPETFESFASKLLIVSREVKPGRITLVIVKEVLGF